MPAEAFWRGNPKQSMCAFTFDDGPHELSLELWLDTLEQGGAVGTFFFTGEWMDRHPDKARDILARGHILAPHTYHHRRMSQLSKPLFLEQLKWTELAYQDATGLPCPTFMRFPYCAFTQENLEWLAEAGYTDVEGEDSGDWAGISAAQIVSKIEPVLGNGTIVVQHANDIAKGSPEALKMLIRKAYEKGLTPVGIPEMMSSAGIDHGCRAWKLSIETPAAIDFPVDDWQPVQNDGDLLRLAYESADWRIPQFTSSFQTEYAWYDQLAAPLEWEDVKENRELFFARRFSDCYWAYARAGIRGDTFVLMDYAAKEAQADTLVYLLRWAGEQARRYQCSRMEANRDIRRMDEMCRQLGWNSEIVLA
ncbi:polysaccharide deacetylase family protein [Cohnella pontilimi]|nr:polysaccharide deacetylase family protein [Cohnella pontilimi]